MSRKVLIFLLAMFLSVAGFGCSKSKVTLTLINHADLSSPEGKVFDKVLSAFQKKYPNITINVETLYNEPYHQKVTALAAAGSLPDIIFMWPGGRSLNLMKNDLVQDLYPFLGGDKDNFVPSTMVPQYEGKLFELPYSNTITHVLYVNKPVLAKNGLSIPKTYEDMVAMVPKLKAAGLDTVIMSSKEIWVIQSCFLSMVVGRIAGDEWTKSAIEGKAKFSDQPFVDSLKFVKQAFDDGVIPKSSIQLDYGAAPGAFVSGKGAFMIDGDWRGNFIKPLLTTGKENDVELMLFPKIPGEKFPNSTSVVTGVGYGMNAKLEGDKAKAAWNFISFMAGEEASKIRLEDQGYIPAYKLDASKLELHPVVKEIMKVHSDYNGSYVLDNEIPQAPIDMLNSGLQALALGQITPEKLAAQFEKAVRKEQGK